MCRIVSASLATILSFAWGVGRAQTIPAVLVQAQTSSMTGVASGQTARLTALNPGVPAPLATGAKCSAQVTFLDDQGNVLKTASITALPGKSASVDLNRDTDVTSSSGRLEIRVTIAQSVDTNSTSATPMFSFCSLIPSLEVFENLTSKTLVRVTDFHLNGLLPSITAGRAQ